MTWLAPDLREEAIRIIVSAVLLSLGLVGVSAAQDLVADGKKVFKRCAACHAVGEDAKKKVGPPLNDLFGQTAGRYEGFKYSQILVALGEAGLVWNRETVTGYLMKPKMWLVDIAPEYKLDCADFKKCKGKKVFAGLKKQKDIDAVIAYLAKFDADGMPDDGS